MESRPKPAGFSGVANGHRGAAAEGGRPAVDCCGAALRALTAAATLVAAVVMGVDRETKTVQVAGVPALPPQPVTVTAKWSHSSAFVYFVVANSITCAFSATALLLSLTSGKRGAILPVVVGDMVVMALLFSAVGAAAEFGLLGERGNAHVRWDKVCDVYAGFCERAMAAVLVSLLGAFAHLVLLMLTVVGIHKRGEYSVRIPVQREFEKI